MLIGVATFRILFLSRPPSRFVHLRTSAALGGRVFRRGRSSPRMSRGWNRKNLTGLLAGDQAWCTGFVWSTAEAGLIRVRLAERVFCTDLRGSCGSSWNLTSGTTTGGTRSRRGCRISTARGVGVRVSLKRVRSCIFAGAQLGHASILIWKFLLV